MASRFSEYTWFINDGLRHQTPDIMLAILLTAIFMFMAAYSFISIKTVSIRFLFCFGYVVGIFFVWHPDASTSIANFFGMGRGLDFFMVLVCIAIINALVLIARQIHLQHLALTKLARSIALRGAVKEQTPETSRDLSRADSRVK